jgi:RND family efflux transporter MFP subunit
MSQDDLNKLRIGDDYWGSPGSGRRRKKLIWGLSIVSAVVVIVIILAWTGRLLPAVSVSTAKVALTFPSRALTELNASGYVVAQRKAAVSSKATGRIRKLSVEEGKVVKAGDILAQLENDDLVATLEEGRANLKVAKAALNNAEAELADAEANYNRNKSLKATGAVSDQAFDAAEARYKKALSSETQARFLIGRAEASLRLAEVNLEYSLIRAPFDGVILTKSADEGEIVAPFGASVNARAAVATMADLTSLMVEVDVSEASLEKVRLGQAVEIRLDAFPNDRFPGTVHMIVPTADRSKATVLTKIKFEKLDSRVLPEMSAKAAFLSRPIGPDEDKPFLGIPKSAIKSVNGQMIVYRVNEARAHQVAVETGREWRDTVEVLSGIQDGDIVILKPGDQVRDGRRVKVPE